jgi:hypothetical protein
MLTTLNSIGLIFIARIYSNSIPIQLIQILKLPMVLLRLEIDLVNGEIYIISTSWKFWCHDVGVAYMIFEFNAQSHETLCDTSVFPIIV